MVVVVGLAQGTSRGHGAVGPLGTGTVAAQVEWGQAETLLVAGVVPGTCGVEEGGTLVSHV
jgi:hypothetical protein